MSLELFELYAIYISGMLPFTHLYGVKKIKEGGAGLFVFTLASWPFWICQLLVERIYGMVMRGKNHDLP